MNRLWVRLSIVISTLVFVAVLIPVTLFLILVAGRTSGLRPPPDAAEPAVVRPAVDRNDFSPWRVFSRDVIQALVIAGILGTAGGIAASRILAAPITQLAEATHSIGAGNLATRVHVRSSSRETDELADAFNKMAAALQLAAEQRNALTTDISHELRTPLTVLEGNLRAALDHVIELDDEQIANLYAQTNHLIRLVNELRELAMAESAQLPLDRHPLDLGPLIQETVAVFVPLAEEKGVTLTAEVAPALPAVDVDHVRVRQVLHNLLGNALRHTPDGGAIVVTAAPSAPGVAVAVRDNGDGIDPQQIEHIFDRFYRTDPSRSRETGGSGLGLAIVKALVEAHGGSVHASSAGQGQGSMIEIYLA